MEPIINSQIPEFKVQAFHNGEFKTVTNKDIEGKWAIFFFYPADFTFVCPTELVDMAEKYDRFKEMGVEAHSGFAALSCWDFSVCLISKVSHRYA